MKVENHGSIHCQCLWFPANSLDSSLLQLFVDSEEVSL